MAHALILGMTESGKTTLAKKLAGIYKNSGFEVLVSDPLSDPSWPTEHRFSDVGQFLDCFWNSRTCAVFVDEAGDSAGQHDKVMQRTATRGRHWGHRCHYISQRGTMINRTIRDQCSHLFLFGTALEDCKIHAKEWNRPELLEAAKFKQGDYFHVTRFGDITRSNIFEEINNVTPKTNISDRRPSGSCSGSIDKTGGSTDSANSTTPAEKSGATKKGAK